VTAAAAAPRQTEKAFQAQIVELAIRLGWLVFHPWLSIHSQPGFPDLILVRDTRLLAIECKRDGEQPTPEQWRWLRALDATTSVVAYVARPGGDWGEIERILR